MLQIKTVNNHQVPTMMVSVVVSGVGVYSSSLDTACTVIGVTSEKYSIINNVGGNAGA